MERWTSPGIGCYMLRHTRPVSHHTGNKRGRCCGQWSRVEKETEVLPPLSLLPLLSQLPPVSFTPIVSYLYYYDLDLVIMTDHTMMETVRVIMAVTVIKMEMVMAPFDCCPLGVAAERSSSPKYQAFQTQSKSLLS